MELSRTNEHANAGSTKAEAGTHGRRQFYASFFGSVAGRILTSDWLREGWKYVKDSLESALQ
jgi:hypothetical protein